MKLKIALALLSVALSFAGNAREYRVFSTENGLSSSLVKQIFEDSSSMIWVATEDGLNRYDGSKFTQYLHDPDDPHSLASNYVNAVFEDSRGRIFVASHSGVQLYDPDSDRFSAPARFANGSGSGQVSCIIEKSDGELVAAGAVLSVINVNGGDLTLTVSALPTVVNFADIIFEDENGDIWIVKHEQGIQRVSRDGGIHEYLAGDAVTVMDIFRNDDGTMYVASVNGGLFRYDPRGDEFVRVPFGGKDIFTPRSLAQSSVHRLFVGTDGAGMVVYNPADGSFCDFVTADGRYGLEDKKVHDIMRDRSGNLWIGVYQKGVYLIPFGRNNFRYFGPDSEAGDIIGSCAVVSLCRSGDGTMWVGTDNDGLYGISPDGKPAGHFRPGLSADAVPSTVSGLFEDSAGHLWLASFDKGCGMLDRKSGRYRRLDFSHISKRATRHISAFAEDGEKRVWIATMGSGLLCCDLGSGRVSDASRLCRGIPRYITSIVCASDGRIYMGTYDGACVLDPSDGFSLRRISEDNIVHTVNEQNDGSIAFGGEDGLMVVDRDGGVHRYSSRDGLPSDTVYSIRQDEDGMTWLGTGKGLCRLRPDYSLLVNFLAEDGIQGNEFSKNTSWKDGDSRLWFGGVNGLSCFYPREIVSPVMKWTVRVTEMYLHNRPVTVQTKSGGKAVIDKAIWKADRISLSHKDNAFTLLFATVEHNHPDRLRFMYKMDGNGWVTLPSGTTRLSFSSLPAGKHLFTLKCSDAFLESDEMPLLIDIRPSFWASGLAKVIYLLLLVGLCAAIYIWLLNHFRAKQALKEYAMAERINESKLQFFVNISHELKNPLSMIVSPLRKLIDTDEDPQRQRNYRIMYRNVEKILLLMDQLLDLRKIDKGGLKLSFSENDMVPFIQGVIGNMEGQFSQKNIALAFEHPGIDSLYMWFDPSNLDKVLINLLSNAYKFTPVNGRVRLLLEKTKDGDNARISVIDNGIGIAPEELENIFRRFYQSSGGQAVYKGGSGVGLDLARSLVEQHGGELHAENNTDSPGARFVITLPLGRAHIAESQIAVSTEKEPPRPDVAMPESGTVLPEAIVVPEVERDSPRTKYRLMLVDDDEELRGYVASELARDFHIIQCSNGKEALDAVFEKAPDIIVSDVVMPVMDGLTLCDKIRQNINLNHIPFVMLTGKSCEEDNITGIKSGADAYISKPFNINLLKATILNLLQQRRMLRNNFAGHQRHEDKLSTPEIKTPDERLLERVMRVLDANMGNPELTIEQLAGEVGISRVHLHRKLKELTNQTTSDFIRNARLSKAARLLSSGKQSISEVAALVGFENQANFATAFKKLYGVTPREYMNNPAASTCSTGSE